jgi:hypothetical protein
MAIINLENIAATASITIQLIKDYSMYESEIISSNGTIFQSTDNNTTLTLRIFKGIEEITNKINDIEWHKFYFENDELKEDTSWGGNKKNLKRIVLDKDDIEEKSIIQASCYSIIDGNRELVSTASITMIKISDIYISDITPVAPSDKMMWMDTNQNPPTLKIWSDDLGYWISSGMDVPIVKNLIRNSNFWTTIDNYYTVVNDSHIQTPTRVMYQNKQWLRLQSKNINSQSGGVYQSIQYPILSNSNYIFSCIGYKIGNSTQNLLIKIISIDKNNRKTTILEEQKNIGTSITSVSVPFTTLNDTTNLEVHLMTSNTRSNRDIYITELSLYNSSVYYPWELCPEDIDKQMNTKLDNSRLSVFNTLTNNGDFKAIYESENQYYIRSEYITPEVATESSVQDLKNTITNMQNTITNMQNTIAQLQNANAQLQTKHTNDINAINLELTNIKNRLTALENPTQAPDAPEFPNS